MRRRFWAFFSAVPRPPRLYPPVSPPASPYLSFYLSCLFLYLFPSPFFYQILVITYLQRYLQSSPHRVNTVGPLICAPVFGHVHTLSCCLPFLIIPLSSPIYPSWLPPYLSLSLSVDSAASKKLTRKHSWSWQCRTTKKPTLLPPHPRLCRRSSTIINSILSK